MKQLNLMNLKTKRCRRCGKIKPVSEFNEHKKTKDKLQYWCKECQKEWREKNPGYQRKWRENNPEYMKKRYKNNLKFDKNWQGNSLQDYFYNIVDYTKYYNPEKNRERNKKRYSILRNRLSQNISVAIYQSLKGNKQGNHWENLVGYTLQELIPHLENLFKPDMSWENMGKWHIDHIRPISSFDFNSYNDPEFKQCWALKNLQPLWASENLSKGAKF